MTFADPGDESMERVNGLEPDDLVDGKRGWQATSSPNG